MRCVSTMNLPYRPARPVVEMPATIWRWKMMYRISGGILAITAAAIVIPRY